MTRLIDVDKLKQYINDCECCEKCDTKGFRCDMRCDLPDCVTPQWERVLNEQPTVDAIPIEWINHYMDTELTKGSLFYSCMSEFMRDWKKNRRNRMKQSLKQSLENLKGRRVYQFVLDETTGKIEDISDSFDYVKVVRCKDCKHRDPEDHKCDCGHDIIWQTPRPDDFYCADGERKTYKEKSYFPKGFFSKERPLAKGEEDETD